MNTNEKLQLKKMISEADCDDNTEAIRRLKHSTRIRDELRKIDTLRNTNKDMDKENFSFLCISECNFLYTNYSDIFHKAVANELDYMLMTKVLTVLRQIEEGNVDQHEGSVLVGKLLKELYVDSALRRADNLDKQNESEEKQTLYDGKQISWKEYKLSK